MDTIKHLTKILGTGRIKTDPVTLQTYGKDWTKGYEAKPIAILFPQTTEEVSKIIKVCRDQKIHLVPSGGRTGLSAGACATNQEVVLSLEKMNKILDIDPIGMTVECEAGVITETLLEAANQHNMQFSFDLAAKGSSQIGGNIATNAGGLRVIRYGNIRDLVLGIEVVDGHGEVLDLNFNLYKNNSGYDLKQLFIGSEGTLGIITKATLKLHPIAPPPQVMLFGLESIERLPVVIKELNAKGHEKYAIEFFTGQCLDLVMAQHSKKTPLSSSFPFYLLIEFPEHVMDAYMSLFEHLLETEVVSDGIASSNQTEFREIWALRELISESISTHKFVKKNDVSVPVKNIRDFLEHLEETFTKLQSVSTKDVDLYLFGHVGDGNFHVNYASNKSSNLKSFQEAIEPIESRLFELVKSNKGSISAEHGIGLLKKNILHMTQSQRAIHYMKSIKTLFDPESILNPGKIFDTNHSG